MELPGFTTIGIIGGTGQMGQWFKKYFENLGHTVLVSGRKTELAWQDLARQCQVVIISLPLDASLDMARQVGPLMNQDQLLMDMCSMKHDINQAMQESTTAQVIGTHPLFGPSTAGMAGQNVIVCPMGEGPWLSWLEAQFKAKGAVVTITDGYTHDRNMAVVQALTHFMTIAFGRTLQQMGVDPKEIRPYATPIFRLKLGLLGRMFAQDTELYRNLICKNPMALEVLGQFLDSANQVKDTLCDDNGIMEAIDTFLGTFPEQGMIESDACLETLAKFTP
ncbi:MAG: prephenate dehydrogenase/arogenate dehydrogenase family protein [Desulfatibacillum sp.]|nr:prephenate dehydrogenase/arogenate dehydrogenase family protein [Desulfatibacillum sp.]